MKKEPLLAVVVALVVAGGLYYYVNYANRAPAQPTAPASQGAPVAQLANPASVNCVQKLGGTLQMVDTPAGQEGYCHTSDNHFCEEWTLFRGEGCVTFYLGTTGHFILLDTGTAPPPRILSVLDLSLGTTTYTDQYHTPTSIGDGTFTYWRPIAAKPTAANCPDLKTWQAQGLGAGLERHVTLNLATLTLTDLGQQRCTARQ
jgi:putative hemolysin